jgi:integral membrane protein (TIGR01906 family)
LVGGGVMLGGRGKDRQALTRPILVSVVVTLSLAAGLGLFILLSFSSFFTEFHHVFFEGNTWLFHQDDTLIRLFPTDFWFDAAVIIAGLTVVELLLVGGGAWWWGRRVVDADEH